MNQNNNLMVNQNVNKNKKPRSKIQSLLVVLVIIFIFFNISFYMSERSHWINKDHAHLTAKEYFVFSEMVFLYRKMLNIFVEVDNPLMYPLNKLHEAIYKKGTSYLLLDDGEWAVWKYKLDLYFYGRKDYMPNDKTPVNLRSISPLRVKILDNFYSAIEALATKPIADSEMNDIRQKIFPLIASYYMVNQIFYLGNEPHAYVFMRLIEDKEKMERNVRLVSWLVAVRSDWDKHQKVLKEIRGKEPQIEMFYYNALIELLKRVLLRRMMDLEFGCDDYYTNLYLSSKKELQDFINHRAGRIRKDQVQLIYRMNFESYGARRLAYMLNRYCGVPKDKAYPTEEWIKESFNNLYWKYDDLMEKSIRKNK